jgi:lipoprotein NlpI
MTKAWSFNVTEGGYDRAIEDFNQAIAFQPDLAETYLYHGVVYADKGGGMTTYV